MTSSLHGGEIWSLDTASGEAQQLIANDESVWGIVYDLDGALLAFSGEHHSFSLWNVETGEILFIVGE